MILSEVKKMGDKKKFWVRAMAIFLVALMGLGSAYTAIALIFNLF